MWNTYVCPYIDDTASHDTAARYVTVDGDWLVVGNIYSEDFMLGNTTNGLIGTYNKYLRTLGTSMDVSPPAPVGIDETETFATAKPQGNAILVNGNWYPDDPEHLANLGFFRVSARYYPDTQPYTCRGARLVDGAFVYNEDIRVDYHGQAQFHTEVWTTYAGIHIPKSAKVLDTEKLVSIPGYITLRGDLPLPGQVPLAAALLSTSADDIMDDVMSDYRFQLEPPEIRILLIDTHNSLTRTVEEEVA